MSTKNAILGAAATCLAVGSAFASYLTIQDIKVRINGVTRTVTVTNLPACGTPNAQKCFVKVLNKNGTVTVAAAATYLTAGGVVSVAADGALVTNTIARTKGS